MVLKINKFYDDESGNGIGEKPSEIIKTFTQDDVDRVVGKVRGETKERIFKSIGIESEDELKKIIEDKKALEESKKSENEKYLEKIKNSETSLNELNTKNSVLQNEILFLKNGITDDDEREFLIYKFSKQVNEENTLESLLTTYLKNKPKQPKVIPTKPIVKEKYGFEKILEEKGKL